VTGVTTLDMLDGCRYGDAAVVMAGTGCAAAVPTALTGWSDWLDTTGAERRVGLVHAAANSAAVLLYATSWLAPRRSPGRGRQHHCPRCGRAFGRGWLGGHLAYARCRRRHHGIPGAPGGLGAHRSGAAAGHGRPELVGVHGIAVLVLRLGDDLVAGGPLYLPG
jgi:hypothetical protein